MRDYSIQSADGMVTAGVVESNSIIPAGLCLSDLQTECLQTGSAMTQTLVVSQGASISLLQAP